MFLRDSPGRTAIHNEDFCSVAIISFNRHHRLRALIDSIHEFADMPFELIVSDDGGPFYEDFNFIRDLRDKVSHFAINLGLNKGMHVNANTAISITRSKHVFAFTDDAKVIAPFMRRCVKVLDYAPYVGCIELAAGASGTITPGTLVCKTDYGQEYRIRCSVGGSWALGFKKQYWLDVGGYAEDHIYGDIPFLSRGWSRGYFSAALAGDPMAVDTDKDERSLSQDSTGKFINGSYANYPKIFRISDSDLKRWGGDRGNVCAKRTEDGRNGHLTEDSWHSWNNDYMLKAIPGPDVPIDWEVLKRFHGKYLDKVRGDLVSR